jgi:hypothetical protein
MPRVTLSYTHFDQYNEQHHHLITISVYQALHDSFIVSILRSSSVNSQALDERPALQGRSGSGKSPEDVSVMLSCCQPVEIYGAGNGGKETYWALIPTCNCYLGRVDLF